MSTTIAQDDEDQIRTIRNASNEAIKAYDNALVLSFLTDDVLTTTGNGSLLAGKEALKKYILAAGESKMYWIRTTDSVVVNATRGLAWESGIWKGYDPAKGNDPLIGGQYATMWTKESGQWLIKSQLFVTLE